MEVHADGLVLLVQAPDEVEHKGAISDNLTQVPERVRHVLEFPTVVRDGQVTLDEVSEFGVEVEGARLTVVEEL